MSGLAKTNNFMLSTATVMIGAVGNLADLKPSTDSIGLVKNFTLTSEPSYTELMQGVKGKIVESIMTSNPVRASMESYEYTSKNITYALGLNGGSVAPVTTQTTVGTAINGTPSTTLAVVSATGIVQGDTILIERDTIDDFVVRKVASVSSNNLTLNVATQDIPVGAKVYKVNTIKGGSLEDQPYLCAKIAGKLTNGTQVVLYLPKIRITKGFTMAFSSQDYGNLPLEFQIYDLVSTDADYADFADCNFKIFTKA